MVKYVLRASIFNSSKVLNSLKLTENLRKHYRDFLTGARPTAFYYLSYVGGMLINHY